MKNSLKLTLICVAALTIICSPFTATADNHVTSWNPGEKIEGPWLWMIASTGVNGGAAAATSGIDYLAAVSGGSVTEQMMLSRSGSTGFWCATIQLTGVLTIIESPSLLP